MSDGWPWTDGSCPLCHSTDRARTEMLVIWKKQEVGYACAGCVENMRPIKEASAASDPSGSPK